MSAARASSGVGILAKSADCDGACSVTPGLICPEFGTKPGLVGTVALSSAWIVPIDDTARTAARAVPSQREYLFFMESLHRLYTTTTEGPQRLHYSCGNEAAGTGQHESPSRPQRTRPD